jgi:hypothetical protein
MEAAAAKAPVPRRSRCKCDLVRTEMIQPNPLHAAKIMDEMTKGRNRNIADVVHFAAGIIPIGTIDLDFLDDEMGFDDSVCVRENEFWIVYVDDDDDDGDGDDVTGTKADVSVEAISNKIEIDFCRMLPELNRYSPHLVVGNSKPIE